LGSDLPFRRLRRSSPLRIAGSQRNGVVAADIYKVMALAGAAFVESEWSEDAREHARAWDAYSGVIFRYCFRRTADVGLAEDLTSIVFLEAWRRRGDVALPSGEVLPWLYGVATNVLRNQRRSQRRYQSALSRLSPELEEPDFADGVADRLDDEMQMREILGLLGKLSRLEQEVLTLCVWEGLTPQEAAVALDVPEVTLRARLHRARQHLQTLSGTDMGTITGSGSAVSKGEHR
jgi:RNA polymerase sigma factor (sigma-70 family)